MYYYVKTRRKGTHLRRALRENGKILVFNNNEIAKKHTVNLKELSCEIIALPHHPGHRMGALYGKKYGKVGW